ncbi:MAG TPA: helix-turn-helix domain-containing protein [Candidatus Thermoplasmatota archaeon]|nr:helix-turn-helix domain-containing protein [Candidatus Thermoplasmatota archaeon]
METSSVGKSTFIPSARPAAVAGLQEFVFKVRSDDNLLCQFTREQPEVRIVLNLLRGDARAKVEKAIFTILADRQTRTRFLTGHFAKRYGTFEVLSEDDAYASVEVSTAVLTYYQRHDPIQATLRMLGPETIFHPVVVEGGYITISVVSPNPAGIAAFNAFTKHMRQVVPADDFKLLHVGEYQPELRFRGRAAGLTARQVEVLKLAIGMGYYDDKRAITLEEIAHALGVSKAAVHKRLQLAENILIRSHFEAP